MLAVEGLDGEDDVPRCLARDAPEDGEAAVGRVEEGRFAAVVAEVDEELAGGGVGVVADLGHFMDVDEVRIAVANRKAHYA